MKYYRVHSFILLLYLLLGSKYLLAQGGDNTFGHVFNFDLVTTNKHSMTREPVYVKVSDTAIYKVFNYFKKEPKTGMMNSTPKSPILLGVKFNPSLEKYFSAYVQSVSKYYQTYIISDSSDAVLIALGINEKNITAYQYRVVENDSLEVIPWSPIPKLEKSYGAKQAYGFIGKYNAPGKRIMVEVVDRKNYNIRDGVIFDWRVNFKPIVSQITVEVPKAYFNLAYPKLNRGYATRFNKQNGLPLDFKFPLDSVNSIILQLDKQETLVYTTYLIKEIDGKRDTSKLDFVDVYGYFVLNKQHFSKPGYYQLIIKRQEKVPIWDDKQDLRIPFEVLAPKLLVRRFSIAQMLPYIGAALLFIAVLFLGYRQYNNRRLNKVAQQRNTIQLKLRAIRSQLNPHFMFNALSSIQNLMNKHETLAANNYLAKFANLTRNVLNTSEQELISLTEELKLTIDYLEMEQLRFGFNYQLLIDNKLDQDNIEIPAMLLQPFIENAVKHGIANLKDKGLITISIQGKEKDLTLTITDNGKGFSEKARQTRTDIAFGLKLSEERIKLLNQIYKEQPSFLTINSQATGTVITITLSKWISTALL